MKLFVILLAIVLLTLPLIQQGDVSVVGRIKIPAIDLIADMYGNPIFECDCCAPLWNGGQASTLSDLSGVNIDDKAHLTLLSDQRLVVECVEIIPCIRVWHWFVSWRGIVKDDGDVLIFSNGTVYRWTIL